MSLGCTHISEEGKREVTVINSEDEKPVANVPLVYQYVKKPYWIVGKVKESNVYLSDDRGIAMVPESKRMTISDSSEWTLDFERMTEEQSDSVPKIYYIRNRSEAVGPSDAD
ncbi:hypothetical protein Caka_3101 [Coraliomargarita akajimensis DSM 45221]|uniref:Uncharacterized protein n=2 Tax=Coraliomargarita TaxID=442430 RepID=D5EI74_CORAD|nr:hypothetical protein Caka_3101 [Coraliomargarita akajimensis DSM 45221]